MRRIRTAYPTVEKVVKQDAYDRLLDKYHQAVNEGISLRQKAGAYRKVAEAMWLRLLVALALLACMTGVVAATGVFGFRVSFGLGVFFVAVFFYFFFVLIYDISAKPPR